MNATGRGSASVFGVLVKKRAAPATLSVPPLPAEWPPGGDLAHVHAALKRSGGGVDDGQTINDPGYIVRAVPIKIIEHRAIGYAERAA